ncbi:MAG: hypothetical protein KC978_09395, partial [Candidatus Omnitrophica bacterium]|nr:hypothetical protein [Candidatus Omnitrophota bacterium]
FGSRRKPTSPRFLCGGFDDKCDERWGKIKPEIVMEVKTMVDMKSLGKTLSVLVIFAFAGTGDSWAATNSTLQVGFAKVDITPPIGTPMTGFGAHFSDKEGARKIHDPVEARALFFEHEGRQLLIVGMDLCFLSRDEADRFKGAIGRKLDLAPSQILLNASHNHTGPRCGTWFYLQPARKFLQMLEDKLVDVSVKASESKQPITMWAGETTTNLPVNRRLPNPETGEIDFAPNPKGSIYQYLPFVLFKNSKGEPVHVMFSIAAHPSNIKGVERSFHISADYPGVAARLVDKHLGRDGALFLQGAAGCAKCSIVPGKDQFPSGTWEEVEKAGEMVAEELIAALDDNLTCIDPTLFVRSIEMHWPMQPNIGKEGYQKVIENPETHSESIAEVKAVWAKDMLDRLESGYDLPTEVPITAQGIKFGPEFRIVAIEGEMVDALGHQIRDSYSSGITMPLGYSNGCQMYLPTSEMVDEGGYEVESYWEYRHPAPLAKGMEKILAETVKQLQNEGIE